MEKLTFKQYLDSKDQLKQAIKNTPTTIVEYEIRKYCSLPVGESTDDSRLVTLKPKHSLIVEWRHDDPKNPLPLHIRVINPEELDEEQSVFWSGSKLQKWLERHAKQGRNQDRNK